MTLFLFPPSRLVCAVLLLFSAALCCGQQADQHGLGGQQKQVAVRGLQQLLALLLVRPADRLHRFDLDGAILKSGGVSWILLELSLLSCLSSEGRPTCVLRRFLFSPRARAGARDLCLRSQSSAARD